MSVGSLCLVVPFIFYYTLLYLHAAKPYRSVSFSNQYLPWAVYLDTTTSILKRLLYSRGIGQVQVWYFECKMRVKRSLKWAWQQRYICGLVAVIFSLSVQLHFGRLNMKLNICHAPFWWGFNSCSMQSQTELTPNTTVTLIEQSHNTHCIATCYN